MKFFQICSSVFLIIGLWTVGYADEHFPFLAQVSKESVNIRAGANTNFEKLAKLSQGTEVIVLAKKFDWYKVQLPITAKTYIRADYLKINQNAIAEVIGDKVNIRATANSDGTSIGMAHKGELVKIITQTNGWWQIEAPSEAVGWIRQDFISLKSKTATPRGVLRLEEQVKSKNVVTVEVKGKLMPLAESKDNLRYKFVTNNQTAYYVQNIPNIDRFKGATVLIKGVILSDSHHSYDYPVLRVVSISLLL
jgi:uncharacterized protein YgiM (DUF1202 family)